MTPEADHVIGAILVIAGVSVWWQERRMWVALGLIIVGVAIGLGVLHINGGV